MSPFDVATTDDTTHLVRPTDSAGSHEAVAKISASGELETQRAQVLAAVHRWPGCTSKELEELSGIKRELLAKRLPDLEDLGKLFAIAPSQDEKRPRRMVNKAIAHCRLTRCRCIRWYPLFAKVAA